MERQLLSHLVSGLQEAVQNTTIYISDLEELSLILKDSNNYWPFLELVTYQHPAF